MHSVSRFASSSALSAVAPKCLEVSHDTSLHMSRTLTLTLVALAFFIAPSFASANEVWDDCDFEPASTTYSTNGVQAYCYPVVMDEDRTVYGIRVYVTVTTPGAYFAQIRTRAEAQSGVWAGTVYETPVTLTASGYYTFTFDDPRTIATGSSPYFVLSKTSTVFDSTGVTQPLQANTGQQAGNAFMYWYWDATPPSGEASTEFNEVIDYVYDPNLDNSFGTSTVGAIFSIAQPDWVSSIGYDLVDPTGVVVDTDFVNDPEAGTYTIAKEYDFDSTGVYTLRAWFIQETGSGYQRVDNPTTLSIIINVPSWVFDPVTGDLVPAASTTIATSTLLAFKVDCPDDIIIGSVCKLLVGFFVPSLASIQGVQGSFANLMTKAPFSFFVQSKAILDGFRITDNALGGSFSLNLYGSDIDIVSSSTAASVGLDSGALTFFKLIMTVGLWLMLAWYLYWRIASIFGV